jgi:hypothetical protein
MTTANINLAMHKAMRLLPAIALTIGLTACGGGSSDSAPTTPTTPITPITPITPVGSIDDQFGLWLTDIATNHVLVGYQQLQDSALLLKQESENFCALANPLDSELDQLKQIWRNTMSDWQTMQWLKVGPVLEDARNFRLYYWPDNNDSVGRGVSKILSTSEGINEAYIAKQNVGAQGLPALEQLLYPVASQDSLLVAEDKDKRCQAVTAISANVATITAAINDGWQPSGDNYYAQFTEGTGDFTGQKDAVEEVVTNWVEQLELVKDEKMLVPLGNASPGLPLEAEHRLSDSAVISIQQNVAAFKVIYTAGDGYGFDNILNDYLEQNSIANEMLAAIDASIEETTNLQGSYDELLKTAEGRATIDANINAIRAIRDILTVDFVQATDINIGFNANDGD